MTKNKNKKNVNPFITPLFHFTMELLDQLCIATHIERSTTALRHTLTLLKTIRSHVKLPQNLIKGMDYLEKDSLATISRSKTILDNEFSKTNIQILIAMWNSLQTSIENMMTILLLKREVRENIVKFDIPKKWKEKLVDESDEDNYRFFLSSWQTGGSHIVDYMEKKLVCFDMGGNVSEELTNGLIEMHALRNCLVHRAGIADKKITQQAPNLKFSAGQKIYINKDLLLKYHKIAGEYVGLLISRIIKCQYLVVIPN